MSKTTLPMARNKIKRALVSILDSNLSRNDEKEIWRHFKSRCAYCGKKLDPLNRKGHLDHLVAQAGGGSNSIYNHVLACAICNGDEKRDLDWEVFLRTKCDEPTLCSRRQLIQEWTSKSDAVSVTISDDTRVKLNLIIEQAIQDFDLAVSKVRALRVDDNLTEAINEEELSTVCAELPVSMARLNDSHRRTK